MLRFQLLLLFPLLMQAPGIAQTDSLSFRHINTDQGLTAGYNWFMRHDSRGYLWISSINGIFRFDGLGMKHYAPDNANGIGMNGAIIQSDFFEDKEGNIWFSTNKAINKYVRQTDQFETYYCQYNSKNIEKEYYIFYFEKDSLLWLKAGNYIFTYNIKANESCDIVSTDGVSFSVAPTADGRIGQIFACTSINLTPFEIITIDAQGDICKEKFLHNGINNKPVELQYALKQADTLVWLFSDQGLLAFNPTAPDKISAYQFSNYQNHKLRKGLLADTENLLITTSQSGLWKFNTKKRVFSQPGVSQKANAAPIASNDLWGIYKDNYDQVWASAAAHANIGGASLQPNQFIHPFLGTFPLPNVNSIAEDAQGRIWCSTRTDGVFVFNPAAKLLRHFPYNPDNGFNNIRQLSRDEKGVIWATSRKSLLIFDENSNNWKNVVEAPDNNLVSMVHLSATHKLICSTSGMLELRSDTQGNYTMKASPAFGKNKKFNISQLFSGNHGLFYAPLDASQLIIINQKNKYSLSKDTLTIHTEVNAIWEETDKPITWLGTSGGLLCLDRSQNKIEKRELRKGELVVGQIWGIVSDASGQLWIASDNGLWCYHPLQNQVDYFGRVEELLTQSFSPFANLRTSDGKIWFGINDGLLVFDPAAIRPFPQKPRVGIQSLKVNDVVYKKKYPVNIDELTNLKLPYRQNDLKLGLVAITQYLPESAIIQYRLRDQDKAWTWIKNGEVIRLFNLPPNKYKLDMVAYNANNIPGARRTLQIEIEPPFWQKWWFKALFIVSIGSIIWGGIALYVRRRLRQQQIIFDRRQALQEERNRIAAELHDDMGAGLSTIRFLSNHLLQTDKDAQTQENIQSIYESSGALFENMRDIIWATNVENDTLESLLFYIQSYAYNFLSTNQLDCEFELPHEIPVVELGGSWRRNVLLTVKEVLHNVVKHAWAKKVVIQITIEAEILQISIQDDGIGLDENKSIKL